MRNFLLLYCFSFFIWNSVLAQFDCHSLGAADSIQLLYQEDAEQMYGRYVTGEEQKGPSIYPLAQSEIYSVSSALLSIYSDENLPHWEEIVSQYGIHTRKTTSTRNIKIAVDTTLLWSINWNQSLTHFETGDLLLDRLLNEFNFEFLEQATYIKFPNDPKSYLELKLHSGVPLNIDLLVNTLENIDGVKSAEPYLVPQEEGEIVKDIFLDYGDDYLDFTFRVSWDCEQGLNCDNTHDWVYRVNSDCSVTFLREAGSLLPLREVQGILSAGLFPNPTYDKVSINLLGPTDTEIKMVLFSALGQIIHSEIIETQSGLLQLDVSLQDQPVGVYFLGFIAGDKVYTEKILKR